MKKIILYFCLLPAILLVLPLLSCEKKSSSDDFVVLDKDTSYAVGIYLAEMWSAPIQIHYDYKAFMEGFRDFNEQQETRLSQEQVYEKIQDMIMEISSVMENMARSEGDDFLAENARKPGIITTASGLQYEVIAQGTGPRPSPQDMIQVHYEGTLLDGTVFDSSYPRGEPSIYYLDRLIPGWKEGILLMNTGSTYRFYIPSDLGYGPQGAGGGVIPPNAVLIFTVELLGVETYLGVED